MKKTKLQAIQSLNLKIKDYEARISRLKKFNPNDPGLFIMEGAIEGYEVSIKEIRRIRRFFA